MSDIAEERSAASTTNSVDTDVSFQEKLADEVSEGAGTGTIAACTRDKEQIISGVPQQDHQVKAHYDNPLPLDQEGTEFKVERLVAKGRIGRRVWYKVKWKGYPESDNSWVKKKDIGTGAIANYEARHH